ncbi:MAG: CBS domain-containing protein, partial [Deltaproteobacteria bacterium]|nr:CBS domain-containing protein [Deltaproteobacteria bacterium]
PIPSIFTILDSFIPLSSTKRFEKAVQKIAATTVADVMTPDPVTVGSDADIEDLSSLMEDWNYHTLPVVDDGELVGVVGKADVLRTLIPTQEAG